MKPLRMIKVLALLMGTVICQASSCEDTGTDEELDLQGCTFTKGIGWPTGARLDIVKPTNCPVKLNDTMTIPVAVTASLPSATDHYAINVTDRNDAFSQWSVTHSYDVQCSGTCGVFQISGTYLAAKGGFASNDSGHDWWNHEFYTTSNGYAHGRNRITYGKGTAGANLVGPSSGIRSGGSFEVRASTDDPIMEGPVTWSFYLDGNYVGASSDGVYSFTAGDPDTVQEVDAVIMDANGRTHIGVTYVTVCPASQFIC